MRRRAPLVGLAVVALTGLTVFAPFAPLTRTAGATDAGSALSPPTIAQCRVQNGATCLTPALLRQAYGVDKLIAAGVTGAGVTIGIVDSFGSPTLARDLATYDAQFGLPPIDLRVVTPVGTPPVFNAADEDMSGWADETTLDVEVAHTIAPAAKIVVIATPVSETEGLQGFPQIIEAENKLLPDVDVFSQSFGASEPTFASAAQIRTLSAQIYPRAKASGVTVLSASGDSGPTDVMLDMQTLYRRPVTSWPASDPLVTAVGGTRLGVGANGSRIGPDSGWSGVDAGGGGLSDVFGRPAFQRVVSSVAGARRAVPDISLDAAPESGLLTFGSFSLAGPKWQIGGGTSQAAPLFAGIVALADQMAGHRLGYLNDVLYAMASGADRGASSGIIDVTHGSNDLSAARTSVPGYPAIPGYDLATGLGTIDASVFVPALVAAVGKASPSPSAAAPLSASEVGSSPALRPRESSAQAGSSGSGHTALFVLVGVAAGLGVATAGIMVLGRRRARREGL